MENIQYPTERRPAASDGGGTSGEPPPASRSVGLPSWLVSVVFHAALVVLLGFVVQVSPQGAAVEPGREVGIVLKHQSDERDVYETEDDSAPQTQPEAAEQILEDVFGDEPPLAVAEFLPSATNLLGPGPEQNDQALDATDLTQGTRRGNSFDGGRARTSVFGVPGEGFKFVYVFDRSGSMGGSGNSPFNAAKAQLIASLADLEDIHQFQIIFYNEDFQIFNPSGQPGRLAFATEQNKELARRFIGGVIADGATQHEGPLRAAMRLGPDVIFFLTDADEPELSAARLAALRRLNSGNASINCIEFGQGPKIGGENFLQRLAAQNGGQYVYMDVSPAALSR